MDDKQIKQMLKDASLWLNDASKRWPKHQDVASIRFRAASNLITRLWPYVGYVDYVERPLGGGDESDD